MALKQMEVNHALWGPYSPCWRQESGEGQYTTTAKIWELWCYTGGAGEELSVYHVPENRFNILTPKEFHLEAVSWQTEIGESSRIFWNG